jgi:hypothetical protein
MEGNVRQFQANTEQLSAVRVGTEGSRSDQWGTSNFPLFQGEPETGVTG